MPADNKRRHKNVSELFISLRCWLHASTFMTKRDFGLVGNLLTWKPDSRLHSLTHEIAQAESGAQQNESRSIYCLCSAYWLHIWMQSAISSRFRSPGAGSSRAENSLVDEFEALIQFIPFHYITFFFVFFFTSTAIKFKWRWKSWNLWPRVLGELLRLESLSLPLEDLFEWKRKLFYFPFPTCALDGVNLVRMCCEPFPFIASIT